MPPNPAPHFKKTRVPSDLTGSFIYTEDHQISAGQGTVLQRGSYTLAANEATILLARSYLVSASSPAVSFFVTSRSANHSWVNETISANVSASQVSSISGFRVSGSGTDTGYWLAIGYR